MSDEDISQPLWDPRLDPTEESMWGPVRKWGRLEFPLPEYRAVEHGRDELARLILDGRYKAGSPTLEQVWRDKAYLLADAIIADGWRKP
jgi:hypothetical protein